MQDIVYICIHMYMAVSRLRKTNPHRQAITEQTLKVHAPGHTADMSAVSHARHVCCVTQQTCLLCDTASMSAV